MLDESNLEIWGLFASAFISSTVAPGGSEAVLAWLVSHSRVPVSVLLVTATVGNTLGALTTLSLGILARKGYCRFRIGERERIAAAGGLHRWGASILFFSWLPIIGDALCFAAGWLQLPFLRSTVAISTGKLFRYGVIAYLFG